MKKQIKKGVWKLVLIWLPNRCYSPFLRIIKWHVYTLWRKISKSKNLVNRLWIIYVFLCMYLFITCSVIVNVTWASKLWPCIWKWLSHGMYHLFSKRHFYVCLFLSFSCIRIFQHNAIFRKGIIPSDKLRSCIYK